MRQLTGVLLASVAMVALASSAQAQDLTRDFTGVKSGSVQIAPWAPMVFTPNPATGQINGSIDFFQPNVGSNGGSVEAIVILNSNLVTFESGTATVGSNSISRSQSGIDIKFTNTGDGVVGLNAFGSTIIPAGMGFYVQDRSTQLPMGTNAFTGYGQSTEVEFSDFFTNDLVGVTFAEAEFDFDVVTNGGDSVLYSLSGIVSLSFGVGGNVVINESLTTFSGGDYLTVNNFGTAHNYLDSFATGISNHHAQVYDWQATDINIPLGGTLVGDQFQTVFYRANVTSWTKVGCINSGMNCIVAFAGFGDPVGRGGGIEDAAAFSEFSAFSENFGPLHAEIDHDHDFVIGGLNFRPVEINAFQAVPEPTTWALMISGFGMAGAALRRRRRVAYS